MDDADAERAPSAFDDLRTPGSSVLNLGRRHPGHRGLSRMAPLDRRRRRLAPVAAALLPLLLLSTSSWARKVGIVGGGVSGTFAARYLADYDVDGGRGGGGEGRGCKLDEIVVFDVSPPPGAAADGDDAAADPARGRPTSSSSDPRPPARQGSRVASAALGDGSTVELGASIIYGGNRLVVEMMAADPEHLVKGEPMNQGKREPEDEEDDEEEEEPDGVGIYDGEGRWALNTAGLFPYLPPSLRKVAVGLYMAWRYNLDYLRLRRAVSGAVASFESIYLLLNDTSSDVGYFSSPADMWEASGLDGPSRVSYGELLDALGVSRCDGWFRLPGSGCLRDELLAATTINTYNQDTDEMNGLVGLVSHVPVEGELFSVVGGNHKLMGSAIRQARRRYDDSDCRSDDGDVGGRVRWRTATVSSVVGTEGTLDVYSDGGDLLGNFDVVILAAPLQQARVDFLVESPGGLDGSVLHPMPLAGVHPNGDPDDGDEGRGDKSGGVYKESESNEHGGRLFAPPLPPVATDPYASVVTTVVSNATLNASHFGLPPEGPWPRTILVTARGRELEGISTLTVLSRRRGLVKTFSTDELDGERRRELFGPHHVVEYEQSWGGHDSGRFGGSVPSFKGGRPKDDSMPYLLYDGGSHWGRKGGEEGPALYYANAVEGSAAAIEISAIGARSVAKLVARRLGMIEPESGGDGEGRDEL